MTNDATSTQPAFDLGATLGFFSLRLWLAARAILTGIEKFAGTTTSDAAVEIDGAVNTYGLTASATDKVYGLEHYHGVPPALYDKLASEPLIPGFLLKAYDVVLGPALILVGVTLLVGIATRVSLFVMALLYLSLTIGLILLKQDGGITWLAVHVLLVAVALFNVRHNRLAVMRQF